MPNEVKGKKYWMSLAEAERYGFKKIIRMLFTAISEERSGKAILERF